MWHVYRYDRRADCYRLVARCETFGDALEVAEMVEGSAHVSLGPLTAAGKPAR